MSSHILTSENMIAALPQVLRNDDNLAALATSIAGILSKRREEIRRLAIYSRIDELPENLLDILAYDFKVDWYDYNYPLETKRSLLKSCWSVHRRLGTKGAVETAITAVYPDTKVVEWFEYGGDPYTFRLNINATDLAVDSESHKRVLWLVDYYKNLRSEMGDIIYNVHPAPAIAHTAVACAGYYIREQSGAMNDPKILEVYINGVE